ncbi:2-polyprenyl-6-methoxyphenol hydroxylase-like FAD-dependent oxidoreductase [Sinomonas atrocyanea]|uniref:FAD-dependent monooxygenase n=1 Tax=Sinomonas atrocyanea TaxID=37927 RepID=UPI002787C51D|nr:FAD-dependent monooxygenase [Sinomonas atrocyanea]MDP9884558.1 2-polyprenyl-6-methoxyphenol hydroxylase-like FAD-dependent oxidoreductase [Sinomonas atrocyanea]
MPAVSHVGVVGAGFAGAAAAILLAEGGVEVDLFDAKPEVSALGSGITIQGNACRILDQLGVWEQVQENSYPFDILGLRAPDPEGSVIAVIPDAKMGGEDYPATIGMYRPDLAAILVERAEKAGVRLHWGAKVDSLRQDETGVDLEWIEGATRRTGRFDLVIGADGLHSAVRELIGIDARPQQNGMGIWRAFVPRPEQVTHTDLVYGGPCYIAGYCPTGPDRMYAYLVEEAQDRTVLSPEEQLATMRTLAAGYHGPWDEVRASLGADSRINYTWFTRHLIDGPWNRGRVVVIGDAAHSCPPTMAQGAAMSLEDAVVLAEILLASEGLDSSVWAEFQDRRLPRLREVVDASSQLADWLIAHERDADVPGLMRRVAMTVSQPA